MSSRNKQTTSTSSQNKDFISSRFNIATVLTLC